MSMVRDLTASFLDLKTSDLYEGSGPGASLIAYFKTRRT